MMLPETKVTNGGITLCGNTVKASKLRPTANAVAEPDSDKRGAYIMDFVIHFDTLMSWR